MIQKLKIQNYRGFTKTTNFDFRLLNIFVGPNSSGKSSIIKLIKNILNNRHYDVNNFIRDIAFKNNNSTLYLDYTLLLSNSNEISYSLKDKVKDDFNSLDRIDLYNTIFSELGIKYNPKFNIYLSDKKIFNVIKEMRILKKIIRFEFIKSIGTEIRIKDYPYEYIYKIKNLNDVVHSKKIKLNEIIEKIEKIEKIQLNTYFTYLESTSNRNKVNNSFGLYYYTLLKELQISNEIQFIFNNLSTSDFSYIKSLKTLEPTLKFIPEIDYKINYGFIKDNLHDPNCFPLLPFYLIKDVNCKTVGNNVGTKNKLSYVYLDDIYVKPIKNGLQINKECFGLNPKVSPNVFKKLKFNIFIENHYDLALNNALIAEIENKLNSNKLFGYEQLIFLYFQGIKDLSIFTFETFSLEKIILSDYPEIIKFVKKRPHLSDPIEIQKLVDLFFKIKIKELINDYFEQIKKLYKCLFNENFLYPFKRKYEKNPEFMTTFIDKNLISEIFKLTTIKFIQTYSYLKILYAKTLFDLINNFNDFKPHFLHLGPIRTTELNKDNYSFYNRSGIWGIFEDGSTFKKDSRKAINFWFNQFEIPYQVELVQEKFEDNVSLDKAYLIDKYQNILLSPEEVGFGFSQIIPVILACELNTNGVLLIEQPESQLHPKLQSRLADLFVENSYDNQILVETHSEYLLRRLQVLVKEKKISNHHIAIFYINKDKKGHSSVTKMQLDGDGKFLQEWPPGFFDESYNQSILLL